MLRLTYAKKIARKYSEIQGNKITNYDDLNEEGKKEVDELYDNHPLDEKIILDLIKKRDK